MKVMKDLNGGNVSSAKLFRPLYNVVGIFSQSADLTSGDTHGTYLPNPMPKSVELRDPRNVSDSYSTASSPSDHCDAVDKQV